MEQTDERDNRLGSRQATDTVVERFWYDEDDTLVVRYEDESELRYLHGEVVAAAPGGEDRDPRNQ